MTKMLRDKGGGIVLATRSKSLKYSFIQVHVHVYPPNFKWKKEAQIDILKAIYLKQYIKVIHNYLHLKISLT